MDSLQEAFNHPPESYEACFIIDACALFDYIWTVEQKHPPSSTNAYAWKGILVHCILQGQVEPIVL